MLFILSIVVGIVLMAVYSGMALNTYKKLDRYQNEIVRLEQMMYVNRWAKSRISARKNNIKSLKQRLSIYCFLAVGAFLPALYIFIFT